MNDLSRQATRLEAIEGSYDKWLLGAIIALTGVGVVMVASSSIALMSSPFYYLNRHLIFLAVGIVLAVIAARTELKSIEQYNQMLLLGCFVLLLAVFAPGLGSTVNGARRWINLGISKFQTVEAVKVLYIVWLSSYLVRFRDEVNATWPAMLKPLGVAGALVVLLLLQPDFGSSTLLLAITAGIGLLGAPWRLMRALRAAGMIIRKRQPRAVVAFGGFASGPGGMATRLHGLPLIVHEQNRAPGLTNRILSRYARRLLTGFPGTFAKGEELSATRCVRRSPPSHRRNSASPTARVRCACWWWAAARVHARSIPACRRPSLRWAPQCRCRCATRAARRCMPKRSRRMPRLACRRRSPRSSPTWPRRLPGPIWSYAAPARPRWPSCARSVSAVCWCHSPLPSTIIRPAMRSTWSSAARRFC